MNSTELQQLIRMSGLGNANPNYSQEQLVQILDSQEPTSSAQNSIRLATETFVQRHWDILKYSLKCPGNCASADNKCPNAQAVVCYFLNKKEICR